jgi:hypothetical protein
MSLRENLTAQIERIDELRTLPFDNSKYDDWRRDTGRILEQIFGYLDSEQHPCVGAFLSYRIPKHFTAGRDDMQVYYANILRYQASLLEMYLADMKP